MVKDTFKRQIAAAAKRRQADLVIKNGKIIDVFNGEIIEETIAITDGMVVGIGDYEGKETIDAHGCYISPGLIDAHVHIESSLVTPNEYAKIILPHGVTTVITDPHELANVLGTKGIDFVLEASENIPLEVLVMLPSCVPASPFDSRGATLTADDLAPYFTHPRVKGLAEVMDFPAVESGEEDMVNKLLLTLNISLQIDGHGAGLTAEQVNIYRTAQIKTDHENITADQAREQVKRGMYVIMREGSAARDLINLIPAVTNKNSRRFLFCSDDKEIHELIKDGTIDYNVRLSIKHGIDPITAIQIASINAAECYQLNNLGAVAPGYQADLLFIDDLEKFNITKVFKRGNLVAVNNEAVFEEDNTFKINDELLKTMNGVKVEAEQLKILMGTANKANIIELVPNSLYTNKIVEDVIVENGYFKQSIEKDQLKIAAVERHHKTGKVGVGIVKGFELKSGAIASSLSHDSHNIIAVGANDEDMIIAINHLQNIGGGFVVVDDGQVIAQVRCQLAGLISLADANTVNNELKQLEKAVQEIGISEKIAPFQLMSFLSLPVIPVVKLTCNGLFDVSTTEYLPIPAN